MFAILLFEITEKENDCIILEIY